MVPVWLGKDLSLLVSSARVLMVSRSAINAPLSGPGSYDDLFTAAKAIGGNEVTVRTFFLLVSLHR